MDKDEQVYCTDCVRGKQLLECIEQEKYFPELPPICQGCWPFDIPDSRSFELRQNYQPLTTEFMMDAPDKIGWLMAHSKHDISGFWLIGATAEGEIIRWDGPHSRRNEAVIALKLLEELNLSENKMVVNNIIIHVEKV